MANKEHLSIIKQGIGTWNSWRKKHRDIVPNLGRANFDGADLRRADLIEADLAGANLTGANLIGVYLGVAYLIEAVLTNADLTGAHVGYTTFANVDLSSVKGLDTVIHSGPSIISIDTLYRSQGKIPEIFLRGAGVPEDFIQYIPSLTTQPLQFYSCFISYSHADQSFARRLHDALQGRGIRCWLDEHQILPGQKIHVEINRGIRLSDKVLLCCSKDSLKSWWVDNEIQIAIAKERKLHKEQHKDALALIPLNLDGYLFNDEWQSGWAQLVRARLASDFIGWEQDNSKFDTQFERVVKALRTE